MNTHPVKQQENNFTSVRDQSLKQEVKSVCCSLWSLSFLISEAPDSSSDVSPDVSGSCDLHVMLFRVSVTSCDYYKHTESQRPGRDDTRPHDLWSLVTPRPHGVHRCGLSCVLWLCRRMFAARRAAWFHYHSGSSWISLSSCRGQWEWCQIIQILIRKPLQCNFLLLVLSPCGWSWLWSRSARSAGMHRHNAAAPDTDFKTLTRGISSHWVLIK